MPGLDDHVGQAIVLGARVAVSVRCMHPERSCLPGDYGGCFVMQATGPRSTLRVSTSWSCHMMP